MPEYSKRTASRGRKASGEDRLISCPVSTLFAVLVGVIGIVVMIGWWMQAPLLVQISPGLAPMQATTAFGFILFASCVFFLSAGLKHERPRYELYLSIALVIWGGINLLQHMLGINTGIDQLFAKPFVTDRSPAPGRMSVMTSLMFFISGISLMLGSMRFKRDLIELPIIFLAAFVAGATGQVLFSYVMDIPPVIWLGQRFSEMAIHTALGFFILSSSIIMQRFRCGRASYREAFRWMWIPALSGCLFAVVSVYVGLETKATQNRERVAELRTDAMADLISVQMWELEQALSRMSERVAGLNADQYPLWEADAVHYLKDFPSLVYLHAIDKQDNVRWSHPEDLDRQYASVSAHLPVSFPDGGTCMAEVLPMSLAPDQLCLYLFETARGKAGQADVVLCAVVNWRQLVNSLVETFEEAEGQTDFYIELEPTGRFDYSLESGLVANSVPIGEGWQCMVSLDPRTLGLGTRTHTLFLVGGVIVSLILAYLVHSIQLNSYRLKQLQEAQWLQARQKARLEAFVMHAPAAVAMFDREMRYMAASVRWMKDFELEGVPIIGKGHYEIFPNISDEWKKIHRRCMGGHVEFNDRDCWRPPGWDHDQYLRWEVRPWREPDGTIGGIMMFTSDITTDVEREIEIDRMRKLADQANRLKSEFLANMSHEIRTPMNGVVGMTSLLQGTSLNNEQKECVDVIRESADALLTLIDDILDFSKIESGVIELENEQFSLTEMVATTVELLAPIAARRHNELIAWVELDGLIEIMGDSGRLRQIITNLLGNAIKFTEGGEIILRIHPVEVDPSQVSLRFEVKDTGIGMSQEQCQKIFQPFVQADGTTARKYGGTGLGLSISQRLVMAMGGEITVSSIPERGTAFSFVLSFSLPDGASGTPAIQTAVDSLQGKRCLLAFYSTGLVRLVEERLKIWGIEAKGVLSVESAREELQTQLAAGTPYDLVLVDASLNLEKVTALPSEMGIMEIPAESRPGVILLKSLGLHMTLDEARKIGIDMFIRKPITPSRIFDSLTNFYQGTITSETAEPISKHTEVEAAPKIEARALVAEDNAVNRKVIVMLLKKLGIEADTVSDGSEAVKSWEQVGYSLIFMDCQMPVMDGFTATGRIRELHQSKLDSGLQPVRPYIIALTANALKGDRDKCLLAGMDDYISKPARIRSLAQALERWKFYSDSPAAPEKK